MSATMGFFVLARVLSGELGPHSKGEALMFGTSGVQRLPTDPIGVTTLTLTNVVIGSSIRIEEANGTLRAFRVASAENESFTLDVYSPGNAKNSLVIKVRKGTTAPKYLPYQTNATLSLSPQSIFIAQTIDTIAI